MMRKEKPKRVTKGGVVKSPSECECPPKDGNGMNSNINQEAAEGTDAVSCRVLVEMCIYRVAQGCHNSWA
jgi:hypothetical protein